MKKLTTLIAIILFVSCKSETKKEAIINVKTETEKPSEITSSEKSKNNGTYLCTINGKAWHYTKASGIVSRHKKTNKHEAIFTFTKQLEKGKETLQLTYDGDTNQLERISVHLKVPKKDGGRMTAMYLYHPNTTKFHPNAKISGSIDLSNSSNATGNAKVSDLEVRFDKENVKNEDDTVITVKGINFKGIGYSEAGKQFGSKGTSANN
ncbi:hypothetical protein [Winogradskyella sp.]|uniref:hypothetical protein n=1 Tax=Winogradskyella sp. TaxID=1883156 RepID=UPI0025DEA9AB|nr:hypothetical protein [Winogradskyella sp.]